MRVIITGGTGFIGSHLAEELIKLKNIYEVKVIDNLSKGTLENIKHVLGEVEFVKGDVRNFSFLKTEFEGYDVVFHKAALIEVPKSIKNPLNTNDINANGTLKVLLAARDCGVNKVVFASSCAVYGENKKAKEEDKLKPSSPYAVTKIVGEEYCKLFSRLYGLETVCLRYFNVYGKRQPSNTNYGAVIPNFINALKNNEQPIIFGDGKQTRDFVYVKDVVKANILALKKGVKGTYNIGSGKRTSIIQLYNLISSILNKKIRPRFKKAREGDIKHSLADISKAKKVLGFRPEYDITKGLKEICY